MAKKNDREDLKNDIPFEAATAAAGGGFYLGDAAVVAELLRATAMEMTEGLKAGVKGQLTPATVKAAINGPARAAVAAFLGYANTGYVPNPGWNRPGAIDAHLAAEIGLTEKTPAKRVEAAILKVFLDFLNARDKAAAERRLEKYTRLFLGLP